MEVTKLSPTIVNYHWQIWQQLTTADSYALKFGSWASIVILRVLVEKIKKNETCSECYETFHTLYMYFYRCVYKVS